MSNDMLPDVETLAIYFAFLDDLRESAKTNMYGSAPYLRDRFAIDMPQARVVSRAWMASFATDRTPAERAAAVKAGGFEL